MAAVGEIYVPSGVAEIRDQFLRDIRLAAIDSGALDEPPTQPGTDWYLLGTAAANLALIGYANGAIADQDQSILTATGDALDAHREALGLPEVSETGASGKIAVTITGATTIPNGQQFLYPNGLRGQVVGTYVNPADGDEIDVESIDAGGEANLNAGETVRFISPPTNVDEEATVATGEPLTGGTDAETDERKRDRILSTLRNKPAGGNWSHIRQIVLESLGSVQDCYVYPAPGGPGSCLVVPIKDYDPDAVDFSRAISSAALQTIRSTLHAQLPSPQEIVVRAVADEPADFALEVTIPDSALSGGNGQGWTDQQPWPELEVSDGGRATVTSWNANSNIIVVNADTSTSPIAGLTHIAWWSPVDREFTTALVVGVSGSAGAWSLTLDRPLVSSDGTGPASGDFVCPAAQNLGQYAEAWVEIMRSLGPGELTSDANRLPRAKRHPFTANEDPSNITTTVLLDLVRRYPEITDISFSYAPTTSPTVPADVATPPNVLTVRRFAVYPK